jgi:hypothetical protein
MLFMKRRPASGGANHATPGSTSAGALAWGVLGPKYGFAALSNGARS